MEFWGADSRVSEMIVDFLDSITVDTQMGQPQPSPENRLIQIATPTDWQTRKAQLSALFDPMACRALG